MTPEENAAWNPYSLVTLEIVPNEFGYSVRHFGNDPVDVVVEHVESGLVTYYFPAGPVTVRRSDLDSLSRTHNRGTTKAIMLPAVVRVRRY